MFRFMAAIVLLAVACSAATVEAALFDLRDTGATAEIESGTIVRDGITATLTPNQGLLNQTASSFGIDSVGADDSDGLDNAQGTETITITFDTAVNLTELTLSIFSAGEEATLTINSFAPLTLTDTGNATDVFSFASNNFVDIGESIVLTHSIGNGFSFDNFTVGVPEPSTFALSLLGMLALAVGIRQRRRD